MTDIAVDAMGQVNHRERMTAVETVGGEPVRAVIFDMDGVVTDSAETHFINWKETFDEVLQAHAGESASPFSREDYLRYVDGVPRHDGIRAFLAARSIDLPEGDDGDDGVQTRRGIAALKNQRFRAWLAANKVPAFEDALAFLKAVSAAGMPTGVFSSSRNAPTVLASAGVAGRFNTILGGQEATELGLAPKPAAEALVETARRLDAEPANTVVVEDAVSGAEAAARGHFGSVIGLARSGGPEQRHALRLAGADFVTSDLSRFLLDGQLRTLAALPSAWDYCATLANCNRALAVFLDYDGTLTPIVDDHRAANLSAPMRRAIERLAEHHHVAIVSGRDLADVRKRVGLPELYYAGSHGFDIAGPGGITERPSEAVRLLGQIDAAEAALRAAVDGIAGAEVERKTFSVAVHYRQVAESDVPAFDAAVKTVAANHAELGKTRGKKVVEFQPRIAWDKARAVHWLLAHTALGAGDPLPLYIGDDLTDEDAFDAFGGRGLGIALRGGARLTLGDCALEDVDEVGRFLNWLADLPESVAP